MFIRLYRGLITPFHHCHLWNPFIKDSKEKSFRRIMVGFLKEIIAFMKCPFMKCQFIKCLFMKCLSMKCPFIKCLSMKCPFMKCFSMKCPFMKCLSMKCPIMKCLLWNVSLWNVHLWNVFLWNVHLWNVCLWNVCLWNVPTHKKRVPLILLPLCPVKSNELMDYQEQGVMYKEEYKFSKQT